MRGRVFVIDDDQEMCDLLEAGLGERGFSVESSRVPEDALSRMEEALPDVVLTDLNMEAMSGIDVCRMSASRLPGLPVIIITAFGTMSTAIDAIRAGAFDFVTKPIDMTTLGEALDRAVRRTKLQSTVRRLAAGTTKECTTASLIGQSAAIVQLRDMIVRIASLDSPVLITGEGGTGMALAARILHEAGSDKDSVFRSINCASPPQSLFDVRESICPGTLFLDEIADLPQQTQPALLHSLEQLIASCRRQNRRLRIISSTRVNTDALVEQGTLRSELLFRLNVIQLDIPPLRVRENDVVLLATHFMKEFSDRFRKNISMIAGNAFETMSSYDWPGNVRELKNVVERAVALARFDQITVGDLPQRIQNASAAAVRLIAAREPLASIGDVESTYIAKVLSAVKGNKSMAARVLGIDRKTLYRKLERYCIQF